MFSKNVFIFLCFSKHIFCFCRLTEAGDLKLPDGKVVVHRSVAHIYKQRGMAGRQAKAERMQEVAMRQMEEAGETPTTLVKSGHRPTTLAERYAMKRQNPFVKVRARDF